MMSHKLMYQLLTQAHCYEVTSLQHNIPNKTMTSCHRHWRLEYTLQQPQGLITKANEVRSSENKIDKLSSTIIQAQNPLNKTKTSCHQHLGTQAHNLATNTRSHPHQQLGTQVLYPPTKPRFPEMYARQCCKMSFS